MLLSTLWHRLCAKRRDWCGTGQCSQRLHTFQTSTSKAPLTAAPAPHELLHKDSDAPVPAHPKPRPAQLPPTPAHLLHAEYSLCCRRYARQVRAHAPEAVHKAAPYQSSAHKRVCLAHQTCGNSNEGVFDFLLQACPSWRLQQTARVCFGARFPSGILYRPCIAHTTPTPTSTPHKILYDVKHHFVAVSCRRTSPWPLLTNLLSAPDPAA